MLHIIQILILVSLTSCNVIKSITGGKTNPSSSFYDNSTGLNCPTGFVAVEGNGILGTVDFCIMKFEAKNSGGAAVSKASGLPWVSIAADDGTPANDSDAFEKCENMTESGFLGTFALISNPEWMTIARNIESTQVNWSGGAVGSGHIPKGHGDNSPSSLLAVTNIFDVYDGTGNNSAQAAGSGWEQRRVHILSNGSEIWDFAGNAFEWVDWSSGDSIYTLGPNDETTGLKEFSTPQTGSLLNDDFLPNGAFTSAHSFGQWTGGSGGAARRGASFGLAYTGVFTLRLNYTGTETLTETGFRCSYRP